MSNWLVTGGAGFIGSNFVRGTLEGRWMSQPDKITVLDALTYAGGLDNLGPSINDDRLEFVQGSICDRRLVDELVEHADVIINFAAESHVDRSIDSSAVFFETNVVGTSVLLDAVRRRGSVVFLHISTDEVYGSVPVGSSRESDSLLPNSPYAASKASSDLIARSYHATYGLDVRVTRCSNNFGPFQHPEKLIPRFITNLLRDQSVPLYGDGHNVRDWLHVDDHCMAIDLVICGGDAGRIYNIGGGTSISNLELTQILIQHMDKPQGLIERVPDRIGHDDRYSVDDSIIRQELGYAPQRNLLGELPLLIRWYEENESWWRSRCID
jgi:dTDP-glucose 4,6-dehydratase